MTGEKFHAWIPFYREFALALLRFRNDRVSLVEKVKQIYSSTGIKMPVLDRDNVLTDIDPFTVFGLFNREISDENRIRILKAVKEIFKLKAQVPETFEGVLYVYNLNAVYFCFAGVRSDSDIENLWSLFEQALAYAKDPSSENRVKFSEAFDRCIALKKIGTAKLTVALSLIAPEIFPPLNRRSIWYIYRSGRMPADFVKALPGCADIEKTISAKDYLEVAQKLRDELQSLGHEDFVDFADTAYRLSEEENRRRKEPQPEQKSGQGNKVPAPEAEDPAAVRYWVFSPGQSAFKWEDFRKAGIMAIGKGNGDLSKFPADQSAFKHELEDDGLNKNDSLALWQFCRVLKPGDVIFAKRGVDAVIGRGVVSSDYFYDSAEKDQYRHKRQVKWDADTQEHASPRTFAMKTLTEITGDQELVKGLNALFGIETETKEPQPHAGEQLPEYESYGRADFLSDVYMAEADYDRLKLLLKSKKNVILQGPPGVGKTFAAKRLAYSLLGHKDPQRVALVQFHQSYSYEDFVEGFRPSESAGGMAYQIRKGVFYRFCKQAQADPGHDWFFIIDEINRGNISRILGELFMLLEKDKRGTEIRLLYSNESFIVPSNVYLIGTMNTADRSLSILDYALRRRFAFFKLQPQFDSDGFIKLQRAFDSARLDALIECVKGLNKEIREDGALGEGFQIGHSVFCDLESADKLSLENLVECEIIPLLEEYWFDSKDKADTWSQALLGALK